MATLSDIGFAAAINILSAFVFFIAFAILRLQPFNDRVYFPKWYIKGLRSSPATSGAFVTKFVNLDYRSYLKFLNWMPAALQMPEPELIDHAGLDSAVYLRIYRIGLKIFAPITCIAFAVMVPVNWTNNTLEHSKLTYSDIDKLSISNIPTGSNRFWTHLVMAYAFTFWTCYVLKSEYELIASMRLHFLASEQRRPDQFTVLVRNVPPDPDEMVNQLVEHFFLVNHPDHFLTHQVVYNANNLSEFVCEKKKLRNWLDYYQRKYSRNLSKRPSMKTGFFGLLGNKVDAIEYYESEIERLSKKISDERDRITNNPKSIMPAAFVSFKTRWGAAVCAQTQQSRNPTVWLTEWAPEPRDVYWDNLAIPYVSLSIRRLIMSIAFFFLTFFFMIPIALVQSLANIEGIEKAVPFLKPIIEVKFIKSLIQGFLPGIALKLFLIFLPSVLMLMSKFEGFSSISLLERRSATRYYIFQFINVFLGSIITGTAFQQLDKFLHQSANEIPITIGVSIPMKATFFITYIMVDGWAGIAGEILRVKPLIIYHLKNFFLVKTEKDRKEAMDPGSLGFNSGEPQIQLYFLLGLVYSVVTPILLPFILVFFALAYVVFRHQIINVYNQEYESAAAFWPDVHGRIITALIVSQLLLMGLLSTKEAVQSTPLLIALPVLTIWFHMFCKGRYEPAFLRYPLQEAMMKDTLERTREPNLNLKGYLQNAYIHPLFKGGDDSDSDNEELQELDDGPKLWSNLAMSKKRPHHTSFFRFSSNRIPAALSLIVLCYLALLVVHRHCSHHAQTPPFHSGDEFVDLSLTVTVSKEDTHHHIVNLTTTKHNATFPEDVRFLGCPKIAFLFLARSALPLDFLWDAFFQTGASSNFSIYVHSEPGFVLDNSTTSSPYFYGRQLNNSIKVSWGGANMIDAEKLLLNAALQDPTNQRFVLLSDSCVPLYNFSFIYTYIMSSSRSFVDSFSGVSKGRYSLDMLPVIPVSKWRKGSQWITLIRKHAHIVANDTQVLDIFRKHCKQTRKPVINMFNADQNTYHGYKSFCVPDEHYVATLLAVKELENDFEGRTLTYTSWNGTSTLRMEKRKRRPAHPDTFNFVDADPKHIIAIREIDNIYFKTENRTERCHLNSKPTTCFLFARKFSTGAALRLLTSRILAMSDVRSSRDYQQLQEIPV
ncbi:unnamed protein product [Rhodiola kirilowii]